MPFIKYDIEIINNKTIIIAESISNMKLVSFNLLFTNGIIGLEQIIPNKMNTILSFM